MKTTTQTPNRQFPSGKRGGLTAKKLHRLSWMLLKQRQQLEKAVKADPTVQAIYELLDRAWTMAYKLADGQDLADAIRKDRGEVCWSLFFPREFYGEPQPFIVRTPNLKKESLFSGGSHLRVADPASVWKDLAEAWKPADPKIMANRQERVDREFRAWQEREAA